VAANILEETLQREISEEVGVTVAATMQSVESKSFRADDGLPVIDSVFLRRYESGEPRDPADVARVEWMTFAGILAHLNTPVWTSQRLCLATALKRDVYPDP
jgi:8-oxo-dGTP pyrophosphatase MutT (NUDIX family)